MIDSKLKSAYLWQRRQSDSRIGAHGFKRSPMTSAARALELAREDVAAGRTRYPSPIWTGYGKAQPESWTDRRFIDNPAQAGLRFVGYADEIINLRHRGWYCDTLESDVFRGAVWQLSARAGRVRFVAGYVEPWNDGAVIDLTTVYSDAVESEPYALAAGDYGAAHDAARAADGFAERAAEESREYDSAWRAGAKFADLGEEIEQNRREALAILSERRKARGLTDFPATCAAIRGRVAELRSRISAARKERARLAEDYAPPSLSWNPWRQQIAAAFADGAGL